MNPVDFLTRELESAAHDATAALEPVHTLREFLLRHARVKSGSHYVPYHFAGREALAQIVERIDAILGSEALPLSAVSEISNLQSPITDQARSNRASNALSEKLAIGNSQLALPLSAVSEISNLQSPITDQARSNRASNAPSEKLAIGNSQLAMQDASLAICGGAQFGKTVLMLNLLVYLTAVRFRNVGYYLPDDDLVQGIVDGKLRPDVLDQIPAIARLIQLGRTLNATGRAVHRKGALLVTDGDRTALAYVRGMGKVPTTFSMDVVIQDEKDDIAEYNAKFLAGRMTASDLRFSLSIGTQRYHGAGQNREFEDGTQHVGRLFPMADCQMPIEKQSESNLPEDVSLAHSAVPSIGNWKSKIGNSQLAMQGSAVSEISNLQSQIAEPVGPNRASNVASEKLAIGNSQLAMSNAGLCPEEHWPQICRLSLTGTPHADDPQLTPEGDFLSASTGERWPVAAMREEKALVYLADPVTGAALDRKSVRFIARRPEREAQRKWSYRVSQLIIDAIDLRQIVAAWEEAVRDPERMSAFCTDRLALPRSQSQGLDPAALQRARESQPYTVALTEPQAPAPDVSRVAGLDMGDRCWFVVVEELLENSESWQAGVPSIKRGGAQRRGVCSAIVGENKPHTPVTSLIWAEMISAERVRERVPQLCTALGVKTLAVDAGPLRDLSRDLCFRLAQGADQFWDESSSEWRHLRAAAVEFTGHEGQGIRHKLGTTQDGAHYPLIACHREETIERVITTLCHPSAPRLLLPQRSAQTPPVLALYEQHLLAGSRQERANDGKSLRYVDKCENHFLLATAYALLARQLTAREAGSVSPGFGPVSLRSRRMEG